MQSQKLNILRHLKVYGNITPLESLDLYGCLRLASRILELKKDGHNIETKMVGDDKRYAKYVLND